MTVVLLVACGGGGGGERRQLRPTPAPTPAPTQHPRPHHPRHSASTINTCFDGDCYDVIQIQGADAATTPGGPATDALRTIYAYTNDTNDTASYEGSAWPYVTTTKDIATIELSSNLSSEIFGKNNDNHILMVNRFINTLVIALPLMLMVMRQERYGMYINQMVATQHQYLHRPPRPATPPRHPLAPNGTNSDPQIYSNR